MAWSELTRMLGLFTEPVGEAELRQAIAIERRRCTLLEAHLRRVELNAPAAAPPHRAALARQEARLAWLERRLREEQGLAEWRRDNPPTASRELRALLHYLGLGPNPFPPPPAEAPPSGHPPVTRADRAA